MGGEGAGKRERLVTDTVNRWEVLHRRRALLGGMQGGSGEGRAGQKDSEQTSLGRTGVVTEVRAPSWQWSCGKPRVLKMAKELVQWGRRWEFIWG